LTLLVGHQEVQAVYKNTARAICKGFLEIPIKYILQVVYFYWICCIGCIRSLSLKLVIYGQMSLMTRVFMGWGDYLHEAQVEERVCVHFFIWFVYVAVFHPQPPALHNIYFIRLWHDIAYMCWNCR